MTTSLFGHLLLFLVMLSAIYNVDSQIEYDGSDISLGSSLTPTGNPYWLSPSGLFAFGFYPEGENRYRVGIFLAGFPLNKTTVIWTANRDDPPVSDNVTLSLTTDGRLIIQQSQDSDRDVVTTDQSISSASMLDSGNFVLYGPNQEDIWESFHHPTDTIVQDQKLMEEHELVSSISEVNHSTGIFRLKMQSDFNLVMYPNETGTDDTRPFAYWATGTNSVDAKNVTLNLDSDGSLYLLDEPPADNIIKILSYGLSEEQRFYLLKIFYDGILRLYSLSLDGKGNSSSVVWESTTDRCAPKGLCGLNEYCSLDDSEPECKCPPGFGHVNPRNRTARNCYSPDPTCNKDEGNQSITMTLLYNTYWDNNPYKTDNVKNKEECEATCLKNCECVVAFFQDGECRQQRLPLKYGRNESADSNIAFFKLTQAQSPPPLPPPSPSPLPTQPPTPGRKKTIVPVLTAGVGAGLAVIVAVLLVSYWGVRRHNKSSA
ncbi:hypothetical protein AgCh_026366 [Apium graveolens]